MTIKYILLLILTCSAFFPCFAGQDEVMTMTVTSTSGETTDFPLDGISEVQFSTKIPIESNPAVSPLANKFICYNGDSLMEGRSSGAMDNGGGAPAIICSLTNSSAENRAKSGASISRTTDGRHNVVADIENMSDNTDLICIEGGVNDFWINVPLGKITAAGDFSGALDETTFIGALESVFRQAIAKWEGKPIVYIIPHKIKDAYARSNAGGTSFASFMNGARAVCEKYGIPYVDGEKVFNLNGQLQLHRDLFFCNNDGIHPNADGYRRYWVGPMLSLFESLLR